MNKEQFDEYTPNVSGVIKQDGVPIKDHEIVFGINSEKLNTEFIVKTDKKGEFNFDAIYVAKDKNMEGIFHEKRVSIYITTNYDKKNIIIWNSTLSGFVVSDFERYNLGNLNCDTNNPISSFAFHDGEGNSAPVYVYSQCSLFGYFQSEVIGDS
ncbi:hypothetical protein C4G41_RS17360 [Vibrio parahaemolyticus]|nr:hypothetical protein [Vibrio parahaemolyticus]EGQ8751999.1 hypothetical protein [Vibrio parahaemolyticus]EGQ8758141.1 hypothetical protein [Vibrio parahaemolyticus]EGQ8821317.1 hypothetical protein [Vibrio parahaemolyticus]EGQ8895935.1 hypothetical protein [Vibrio parahaemolyticus]